MPKHPHFRQSSPMLDGGKHATHIKVEAALKPYLIDEAAAGSVTLKPSAARPDVRGSFGVRLVPERSDQS